MSELLLHSKANRLHEWNGTIVCFDSANGWTCGKGVLNSLQMYLLEGFLRERGDTDRFCWLFDLILLFSWNSPAQAEYVTYNSQCPNYIYRTRSSMVELTSGSSDSPASRQTTSISSAIRVVSWFEFRRDHFLFCLCRFVRFFHSGK